MLVDDSTVRFGAGHDALTPSEHIDPSELTKTVVRDFDTTRRSNVSAAVRSRFDDMLDGPDAHGTQATVLKDLSHLAKQTRVPEVTPSPDFDETRTTLKSISPESLPQPQAPLVQLGALFDSSVSSAGGSRPSSQPTPPLSSSRPDAALPTGMRVGEYVVEAKIGEGAMGSVYRAMHPALHKHVAIKIMSSRLCHEPAAVERFKREARMVAAIRHPGVVDVFGFGALDDGRAYLIMEWLDGVSLRSRIKQGPIPIGEALSIVGQTARALVAAHEKAITHRDLKPDNIFLQSVRGEPPVVKIVDFGLAKLAHTDLDPGMTATGQVVGTPLYMSPEQCRGKGVDRRTDTYALGCIAYEIICGRVPFPRDNVAEIMSAHLKETPPPPRSVMPTISAPLESLILAMMDKDPNRRPALETVRDTIASLRDALPAMAPALQPMIPGNPARSPTMSARAPSRSAFVTWLSARSYVTLVIGAVVIACLVATLAALAVR